MDYQLYANGDGSLVSLPTCLTARLPLSEGCGASILSEGDFLGLLAMLEIFDGKFYRKLFEVLVVINLARILGV